MAKDRNGNTLEPGDKVLIPCTVQTVHGTVSDAKIHVQPDVQTGPGYTHLIPVNSGQVDKVTAPTVPAPFEPSESEPPEPTEE